MFENNDDNEMRNEKNKIKSDPSQEVILYCIITIFPRKNFSMDRVKAIFISWN